MEEYVEHNDLVKEILINEFFFLVISSPKLFPNIWNDPTI